MARLFHLQSQQDSHVFDTNRQSQALLLLNCYLDWTQYELAISI